jgi:hypothetical protein
MENQLNAAGNDKLHVWAEDLLKQLEPLDHTEGLSEGAILQRTDGDKYIVVFMDRFFDIKEDCPFRIMGLVGMKSGNRWTKPKAYKGDIKPTVRDLIGTDPVDRWKILSRSKTEKRPDVSQNS